MILYNSIIHFKAVAAFEDPPPKPEAIGRFFVRKILTLIFFSKICSIFVTNLQIIFFSNFISSPNSPSKLIVKDFDFLAIKHDYGVEFVDEINKLQLRRDMELKVINDKRIHHMKDIKNHLILEEKLVLEKN